MAMKYNRISADGHIECPPTAWVERMPKNLREFAPKVVRLPDGGDGVQIGNHEPAPLGLQLCGGQKYTEFRTRGTRFEDNPPGTGDPAQRLKEMDQDGVDGLRAEGGGAAVCHEDGAVGTGGESGQIGGHAGAAVDGDLTGVGVAGGGIVEDFDAEVRGDVFGRPGEGDAEEAAVEE